MSPMTPPPRAMKVLLRSSLLCNALSHTCCRTSRLLNCSPSGRLTTSTSCLPPAVIVCKHLQTQLDGDYADVCTGTIHSMGAAWHLPLKIQRCNCDVGDNQNLLAKYMLLQQVTSAQKPLSYVDRIRPIPQRDIDRLQGLGVNGEGMY